ncbi:unnamed protein product [Amoebophrya sp. A25]|nr:unnamed protein product [Amoebophrya sp. A25]|eukprot:GSA25T00011509001.1
MYAFLDDSPLVCPSSATSTRDDATSCMTSSAFRNGKRSSTTQSSQVNLIPGSFAGKRRDRSAMLNARSRSCSRIRSKTMGKSARPTSCVDEAFTSMNSEHRSAVAGSMRQRGQRVLQRFLFSRRSGKARYASNNIIVRHVTMLLAAAFWEKMLPALALYRQTCEPSEVLTQVKNTGGMVEASTCATPCVAGNGFSCPAEPMIAAKPVCALQGPDLASYFCALACNLDNECPPGGTCRQIVRTPAVQRVLGVCITPATADAGVMRTTVAPAFPPVQGLERVWTTIAPMPNQQVRSLTSSGSVPIAGGSPGEQALKMLATVYNIPPTDTQFGIIQTQLQNCGSSGVSVPSTDGNWLDDVGHDVKYIEKHILEGDIISKELHDTYWNITHLDRGAYAILHSLTVIMLLYCAIGACLKAYVTGAQGWERIPHKEFWQDYPNLVVDGMHITKNFVQMEVLARATKSATADGTPAGSSLGGNLQPGGGLGNPSWGGGNSGGFSSGML